MDGTYRIGTDHIRSLAIECHALDVQFDRLFNCETICGYSDRIYQTYNRLLSTALLNLAVSIQCSSTMSIRARWMWHSTTASATVRA